MSRREFALFIRVEIGEKIQRGIKHGLMANHVSPVSFIKTQSFTTFFGIGKKRIKACQIKVFQ